MANEANHKVPHDLHLQNRQKLSVSGVQEIESFDENTVVLLTSEGMLVIRGENLQLQALSIEGGQVAVEGLITSLDYEEARKTGGFFRRLFS